MNTFPSRARVALLCLLAGCDGGAKTAAQLVLTPDPVISPAASILKQVRRIDVVVDGRQGLLGISQPGPLGGSGTALDWDGDGELEVRFQGPALEGDALPVLEVGVSENAGRELTFRIFGFASGGEPSLESAVALGGAAATVETGEVRRVGAPFNLGARARPPQVLLSLPAEGVKVPYNLKAVTAVLSTTVRPESLANAVRFTTPGGAALPVKVEVSTATVATAFGKEERSMLSIEVGFSTEGQYALQIGPGIVSTSGLRFDQDPLTDREDAFFTHFLASPAAGGGYKCEWCPDGYLCHDTLPGCIPALACGEGCGSGFVCDPGQGQCVEDCRKLGVCLNPAAACEAQTGLCRQS